MTDLSTTARVHNSLGASPGIMPRKDAEKQLATLGVRTLNLARMTTEEPPPRDYIFGSWALTAGTYGLIYAPGGTGKSYLVLTMLLTLALAGADCEAYDPLLLCPRTRKGGWPVTYITGEDSDDAVWHRVHALTRDMRPEAYLTVQRNMLVLTTQGLVDRRLVSNSAFRRAVTGVAAGHRLVAIDTLSRFHAVEENSNSEMASVVTSIEAIARETGASVVATHHCTKTSQQADGVGGSGLAIRGASCIRENARWALRLTKVNEDVLGLVEGKHNDGHGHNAIHITWTNAGTLKRCSGPSVDARVPCVTPVRHQRVSGGGHGGIY